MKSLEIVNEKIEETKYPTGSLERPVWDDETIINKTELQQIKQDLEVLEIIRKNTYRRDYNSLEPSITFIVPSWLSKEDLAKVKQWLEENEHDR